MTSTGYLVDLGLKEYTTAWNLQRSIAEARCQREVPDVLLLAEHPHVITTGRKGNLENIHSKALPVYHVERGGDATYHGPGQLVGYPILSLEDHKLTIHEYLNNIEEAIIKTLQVFRIQGGRRENHRGVWVGDKKVASIGIAIRKSTTFHGFALNVNTDLSYFGMVNPCGLNSEAIVSMETLTGKTVPCDAVKATFVKSFCDLFDLRLESLTERQLEERHPHVKGGWLPTVTPPPRGHPEFSGSPDNG